MDRDLREPERQWRADPGNLDAVQAYDRSCQRSGVVSDWRKGILAEAMFGVLVQSLMGDRTLRRWGKETNGERLARMGVLAGRLLGGDTTLSAARLGAANARALAQIIDYSSLPPPTPGIFARDVEKEMKLMVRAMALPRHLVQPSLKISYRATFR